MPTSTNTELRVALIAEAHTWVGTPFHDGARVKGGGVDCANLFIGVHAAVGMIEAPELAPYSPQWFQHRDEPIFLKQLSRYAQCVLCAPGEAKKLHEIGITAPEAADREEVMRAARPADMLMYNFGRHAAHGAILIDGRTIIHAYKPAGAVVIEDPQPLVPRLHSVWSVIE